MPLAELHIEPQAQQAMATDLAGWWQELGTDFRLSLGGGRRQAAAAGMADSDCGAKKQTGTSGVPVSIFPKAVRQLRRAAHKGLAGIQPGNRFPVDHVPPVAHVFSTAVLVL